MRAVRGIRASLLTIVPALVLAAALPAAALAQTVTPLPFREGTVSVAVRATKVNDFDVTAPIARASFTGTTLGSVSGSAEVRVADMQSGIGLRDTHMRNALRADSFPAIRFELVGLDPAAARGDSVPVTFQGHLTLHGVTHTIRVPGTVVLGPGGAEAVATFPLDMRFYGIDPPSRFLGAIRVQPSVDVTIRLRFGS